MQIIQKVKKVSLNKTREVLFMPLGIVAGLIIMCAGYGCNKKDNISQDKAERFNSEVSMKPTASDEDPLYVYFTADSSGRHFTCRIKSNGTGLEKLYESNAEPIWISPDNRYVFIPDQTMPSNDLRQLRLKGINIWDIEERKMKELPFYKASTLGSGWYDDEHILYAKAYHKSIEKNCLYKQNIRTGDTSIVFCWDQGNRPNAIYNKSDNRFYYIGMDSLYVFENKSEHYTSFPLEYSIFPAFDGEVTFTDNGNAIVYFYLNDNPESEKNGFNESKYVVVNLKGETIKTIDESIDTGCTIGYMKVDKWGKWIYYACSMNYRKQKYDMVKRKRLDNSGAAEVVIINKTRKMQMGFITLGYE